MLSELSAAAVSPEAALHLHSHLAADPEPHEHAHPELEVSGRRQCVGGYITDPVRTGDSAYSRVAFDQRSLHYCLGILETYDLNTADEHVLHPSCRQQAAKHVYQDTPTPRRDHCRGSGG
nr:hypothetical protein CFP56_00904 [Quercus suber]